MNEIRKGKEIPFWAEAIVFGLFLYFINEVVFPFVFSQSEKNPLNPFVAISIYLVCGFFAISLIRLYKWKFEKK